MAVEALRHRIAPQLDAGCAFPDPQRDSLLARLFERHGAGVLAVLVYGSYLRGRRDTLLDFYVLLDGYRSLRPVWQAGLCFLLSPNVYQVQADAGDGAVRAKYALMTLGRFEHSVRRDFHPYIWARFAQPCGLLYARDASARERVIGALAEAARHFVGSVVPQLPDEFTPAELATTGFALTYACELRTERPGQMTELYEHGSPHYAAMLSAFADAGLGYRATDVAGRYRNCAASARRRVSDFAWSMRRGYGKPKSVLRLLKAALTFDGGFDYLLWKIERHSGQRIEPTARQRRYPLLFAWPLLWRLYRRGAFR